MIEHKCIGRSGYTDTHPCWCEISRNHSASEHKAWIAEQDERAELEQTS